MTASKGLRTTTAGKARVTNGAKALSATLTTSRTASIYPSRAKVASIVIMVLTIALSALAAVSATR